jgi:trimeric autotransporter adhesin
LSKAIDDAALGGQGSVIAQDWLNLRGERGLSNFDRHHTLNVQMSYSTGVGAAGGGLLTGWKGVLVKEWTIQTNITVASGLPLSPFYPAGIAGTGVTGIRPNYTGLPLYDGSGGAFLNLKAFAAPPLGEWGNAGRDSIIGPSQFSLNASMGRSFTVGDRHSIDLRFDATNALNHVSLQNWVTNISSPQFGLPTSAAQMRVIRANVRLRF